MKAKIEFYLEPELKNLLIGTIKSKGNIESISQVMRRLVYEYVVEEHINKIICNDSLPVPPQRVQNHPRHPSEYRKK